jgi:low temperature requirement protein LtrA
LNSNVDKYSKWEYVSSYFSDILNSIIIVQNLGSKGIIALIVVTVIKCVGSIYFRYEITKSKLTILHNSIVAIFESIVLILLGTTINDYRPSMAIFIVAIVMEVVFTILYVKIEHSTRDRTIIEA